MRGGGGGQDSPGFHPEDDGVCCHVAHLEMTHSTHAHASVPPLSHVPTGKRSAELPPPGKTVGKPFSQPDEGRLWLSESRSEALLTLSGGSGKGVVPGVLSFDGSVPTSDKMDCWVSPAGV